MFSGKSVFVPTMGYLPVLETLAPFSEGLIKAEDAQRLTAMNVREGMEYTFTKVLPAIERFVSS